MMDKPWSDMTDEEENAWVTDAAAANHAGVLQLDNENDMPNDELFQLLAATTLLQENGSDIANLGELYKYLSHEFGVRTDPQAADVDADPDDEPDTDSSTESTSDADVEPDVDNTDAS